MSNFNDHPICTMSYQVIQRATFYVVTQYDDDDDDIYEDVCILFFKM